MALDATQRKILNSLFDRPQTIRQLAVSTGLSDSTVRQTLRLLTTMQQLKMDKERQPYVYSVSEYSQEFKRRSTIDKAKNIILGKEEGLNPVTQHIARIPKEQLEDWSPLLRSIADAIDELKQDGLLMDTLEVK